MIKKPPMGKLFYKVNLKMYVTSVAELVLFIT
jgi:hypothetical protein